MSLLRNLLITGLLGGQALAQTTSTAAAEGRPNIVFIMADDLGREALSCYGNEVNHTPNLDRLAASGMKFTEAYATPLCTPSRVQVMTGKYNNRNYMVFGLLKPGEKTFGNYMKDAGYATGIAGKWQLLGSKGQQKRAGGKIGSLPAATGFDQYCLWQVDELGSRYKNPTITTTTGTETLQGKYGPDLFSDFAINFIRENRDRPFFFYYPMVLTHDPFQPVPGNPDYATAPVKGTNDPKYFKGQVEYMDKLVGRVADEVKALGLAEKTLIIFTGDNGTGRAVVSTVDGAKIQGAKGASTRYGTNVPFMASWPGKIKPGTVNDNLVDFTDILPTFLDVAGIDRPTSAALDGNSILPQLLGKSSPVREWVFCYYYPQLRNDKKLIWAHDKQWKLYDDGRFYNIAKDVMEEHPIAEADMTDAAKEARAKLRRVIDEKMGTHR